MTNCHTVTRKHYNACKSCPLARPGALAKPTKVHVTYDLNNIVIEIIITLLVFDTLVFDRTITSSSLDRRTCVSIVNFS